MVLPFCKVSSGVDCRVCAAWAVAAGMHPCMQRSWLAAPVLYARWLAVQQGRFLLLLQVRGLKRTALILPENYPSFTLLRQALGAIKLGFEALTLLVPEVGT